MTTHRIGLVVPTPEDRVPAEAIIMYPDVDFVPRGTGVRALTPAGYDAAVDKILPAAEALARDAPRSPSTGDPNSTPSCSSACGRRPACRARR